MKYRGFTRLGAHSKGATPLPSKYYRKPSSLRILEIALGVLSVGLLVFSIITIMSGGESIGAAILTLAIALVWLLASVLLATEHHWYKPTSGVALLCSVLALALSQLPFKLLVLLFSPLPLVAYLIYYHAPGRAYYNWVRSNVAQNT